MAINRAVTNALGDVLESWTDLIDRRLQQRVAAVDCPERLQAAMQYSLFAGGKRLRPLLVLLANEACMGGLDAALSAAAAVEMIHTYSLIHDDLPAMDDDDLRRGQPTCHKKFDEATAILAGDALLTLAFELIAEIEPAAVAVECAKELARASGAAGMVGGQIDDLNAANGPGTVEWLQSLHARKTGALLTASLRLGAFVAGASSGELAALSEYGRHIGLAFQIADDLLDVEGEAQKLGKEVRKDVAAGKLTYPGLLGIDESRRRARDLADQARRALGPLGPSGHHLAQLADYIVERDH